jgi:hypothetical protein
VFCAGLETLELEQQLEIRWLKLAPGFYEIPKGIACKMARISCRRSMPSNLFQYAMNRSTSGLFRQSRSSPVDCLGVFALFCIRLFRQSRDEPPRIVLVRRVKDLIRRSAFCDSAFVKYRNPVTQRGDGKQIVRNIQNGHAKFAIQSAEEIKDFGLRNSVKRACCFVRN